MHIDYLLLDLCSGNKTMDSYYLLINILNIFFLKPDDWHERSVPREHERLKGFRVFTD
jgi:hypothetical protein